MDELVLVDRPTPYLQRITLNRPEKRNALSRAMQQQLLAALGAGDEDAEIRVQVIRGAGPSFCAGYDLSSGAVHTASGPTPGDGHGPRRVTEAWMSIWDLAKPVIAQVHGYCLAGGSELATGCDLIFVADDAQIGYPAVRFGVPDMQFHAWFLGMRRAMEMMVTGSAITGEQAAELGWANRAVPADQLDHVVLETAARIAAIPADVVQINKRAVHRGMEVMGLRAALRAGTETSALGAHQASMHDFLAQVREHGLTAALNERDAPFGDYRAARKETEINTELPLNINARGPIARDHARRYIESDGADGVVDDQGRQCLLLTTQGRVSGEPRRNVLLYGREGDSFVVVASRGGDVNHPHWYLNLVDDPRVQVQVGAARFVARARTVTGAERDRLWKQMSSIMPQYDDFQAKAGRVIPVVVLDLPSATRVG